MKKNILIFAIIAFVLVSASIPAFRVFNYGIRVIGDLKVDSTLYLDERTAGTSDSALVLENGIVKYNTSLVDTALWGKNGANLYTLPQTTKVGIGTGSSPGARLHIIDSTGSSSSIYNHFYSETAGLYSTLALVRSKGTGPSSYDALADNSGIGVINFAGSYNTSSGVATSASIYAYTSELWDGSGRGTEMYFKTAKNNETTVDTRILIDGSGNVNIGSSSGDSTFNVKGGAQFDNDIEVYGGWQNYTPTWTWTGGNIGTPATVIAKYNIVNSVVEFNVYATGTNESGSTSTQVSITLPCTPDDDNWYSAVHCLFSSPSGSPINGTRISAGIDGITDLASSRVCATSTSAFSISNSATFTFVFTGKYKCTTSK